VLGQAMAYDPTTGRKTSATTKQNDGNGGWADAYSETYGYDAETGFLTSAQYSDDGSWNGSWAYDASGNRTGTGWDYDRLDRMTASPGIQNYVHDMAGNRLWRDHMVNSPNVVKHTWDELNRMKSVQGTQDGSVNFYRADGLRARRVTGVSIGFDVDDQGAVSGYYDRFALDRPTWRYYHDGQAPFEDDVTYNPGSGTRKDVTRYALGARGGDMVETVLAMGGSGERTVRSYPLYDGHGNTVAQIARAEDDAPGGSLVAVPGAPAFELGARRKYGAWGQVRWSEGAPLDQGYCGSLQHRRDAESGLVYMRARYYEPWTGRFVSEDPARNGTNWYTYCDNDPVNLIDATGESPVDALDAFLDKIVSILILAVAMAAIQEMAGQMRNDGTVDSPGRVVAKAVAAGLVAAIATVLGKAWIETAKQGLLAGMTTTEGKIAIGAAFAYGVVLAMFIALLDTAFDSLIDQIIRRMQE
jgi:RHS repeat-associated protein